MYHGNSRSGGVLATLNDNNVRWTLQFEASQVLEFKDKVQTFHATLSLPPYVDIFEMDRLVPAI